MSSSKSPNEDVKWALSNRKLGSLRTALKKTRKMHKYAISEDSSIQGKTEGEITTKWKERDIYNKVEGETYINKVEGEGHI